MDVGSHFQLIASLRLPVYRQCYICVWVEDIVSHLCGRQHRWKKDDAREVQRVVQEWPQVLHRGDPVPVMDWIMPAIPELATYNDGLLCQVDPEHCCCVRRGE